MFLRCLYRGLVWFSETQISHGLKPPTGSFFSGFVVFPGWWVKVSSDEYGLVRFSV